MDILSVHFRLEINCLLSQFVPKMNLDFIENYIFIKTFPYIILTKPIFLVEHMHIGTIGLIQINLT